MAANVALAFGPWFVRMADSGPVAAAFWRMMLAAPVLMGASLLLRQQPIRRARGLWWVLGLSGLAFAADLASWHAGILQTTLANSTLFGNVATLIFPVYGFIIARAWPTRLQAIALGLAAAGGGLLLGRSAQLSPENLVGDLLCLGAGLFYTVYFILMSRVRETMAPLPALALSSIASVPLLLVATVLFGESILPGHWGGVFALAMVSQVFGQGLMIYALGKLSPLVVGIGLLAQPVVSGAIGWIAYGERLGGLDFVGAGLVAVALVLVRKGGRTPVQLAPVGAQAQRKTHG
ncbi:MAG TPA: DMT family transporter [Sphingomonas sp.]|nr:DMT family transporter [Sphingomonas sp.]HWK36060.1 DMT family transporter [Sphingomonas sp.]